MRLMSGDFGEMPQLVCGLVLRLHAGAGGQWIRAMTRDGPRLTPANGVALLRANAARLVASIALVAVLAGLVLAAVNQHRPADWLWAATTAMLLLPLSSSVVRSLLRRDVGVDAIALVSMAGALALGEYLAGAVVALMLAGGNALEEAANRRARRELTALVRRAPHSALVRHGEELVEVPIDAVSADDVVLVRAGEVVPVDGMVESGEAIVDESALTGEPLPVTIRRGGNVRSGTAAPARRSSCVRSRPRRERLCRARATRRAGRARTRAVRAYRRPLRALLPARDDGSAAAAPGRSRATRSARWPCSWWRHRAR